MQIHTTTSKLNLRESGTIANVCCLGVVEEGQRLSNSDLPCADTVVFLNSKCGLLVQLQEQRRHNH
eukprot:m.105699 g.105699  ORF g.105699 m.105699 type:complete len:66 (+) comp12659_c0_seq1:94-291(+)